MASYKKAESWGRANTAMNLWYAQEESDKEAIMLNEEIGFGDYIYVVSNKKKYMVGEDNQLSLISSGGGSGGSMNWDDIIGKPDGLVVDEEYVHTDNNFTDEDKEKVDNVATFPEGGSNGDVLTLKIGGSIQFKDSYTDEEIAERAIPQDSEYVQIISGESQNPNPQWSNLFGIFIETLGPGLNALEIVVGPAGEESYQLTQYLYADEAVAAMIGMEAGWITMNEEGALVPTTTPRFDIDVSESLAIMEEYYPQGFDFFTISGGREVIWKKPQAGGGTVKDVKAGEDSVVSNGVAQLPLYDVKNRAGSTVVVNGIAYLPLHDVKNNGGTSIVSNGVAWLPLIVSGATIDGNNATITNNKIVIPVAKSNGVWGMHKTPSTGVITTGSSGELLLYAASSSDITNRKTSGKGAVTVGNMDQVVKAALCDTKGTAWTAAEQQAALQRLGILSSEGVNF